MHVLMGLLIAVVLGYLIYRSLLAPAPGGGATPVPTDDRGFAFLANGLLFYRLPGTPLQQLHSPYVQESLERRERSRERHAWKQGTSFGVAAGGGLRSFETGDRPIQATSAAFDGNGDLFYFLKDGGLGGLFRREAASGSELRVLLRPNLHLEDLSLSPAWIPGDPDRLLYQSMGLARNDQGYIVAQGQATIQMLDMASGSITPVLEHPDYDFLKPRVSPAGHLLFIRRPYKAPHYGLLALLGDTLLFPLRLLRALFHYLNFFSLMYARKPLTSANGPAVQADMKNILLQGRRIDAEKALRSERPVQGVPSLVPASWQLVSRSRDGAEQVLASHVVSFDIGPDGTVVYSNGRGVFVLDGSDSRLALRDELVAEVVAGTA